jgi:ABC-2 type transport system permease protein
MRWHKIGVVASTEFTNAVRTKAFVVGVLLMPLLMAGLIGLQAYTATQVDTRPRKFAVLDETGRLYQPLAALADLSNRPADADAKARPAKEDADANVDGKTRPKVPLVPEKVELGGRPEREVLLELSDRVRKEDLFAFVVLPADLLSQDAGKKPEFRYYTNTPTDMTLPAWLETVVNALVRDTRLRAAGIDPILAQKLSVPVKSQSLTLLSRAEGQAPGKEGEAEDAGGQKVDKVRAFAVPFVLAFIVFMLIMTTAGMQINSVIEEKMSRISEVLLGSLTPVELMAGKLLGNIGVALLISGIYMGGLYGVAYKFGYADSVPLGLLAATLLFLVMAISLYGSLFLALGSACSEVRDSQSLITPVMILAMLPMYMIGAVVGSPNGQLATALSLVPPWTPFLMLMRMAMQPGPPAWQVGLSMVLTAATVLACVWAAGKIFRVGLLMQGKPPSFAQIARWVMAK